MPPDIAHPFRLVLSALAAMAVAGALVIPGASPAGAAGSAAVAGTTYYVSASGGDDTASGLDEANAWQSMQRVNETTFRPGDRILLRAGDRWRGQLWPKGSGETGAPIVIDGYGAGAKPRIDGEGLVGDVVRLFNQEHWAIRNLEVTNAVPATGTPGENLRDLRGIHVSGDNSQTLDGFVIDSVDVHDVTGEVNWISGDTAGDAPGIRFRTGWDTSKKTGGIVFDTTVPDINAPPSAPTILNDVLIENSTVANTSFAGIVVKQYTGDARNAAGETIAVATGWGTRESPTDPTFAPHTNVAIRNNYVTQAGTAYGCNGMYITNVRGAVVEHNVVYRAGTSGIETYFADDATIQFNEVYETERKAGGADWNGIDPDKGTTRQLVQYNYVHGNGDGMLLAQFSFGDVVIRNNVITGSTRYQIYLHSDRAANAKIYNNTIYNDRSGYLIYGYGSSLAAGYDIGNNLIYSTRADATLTTSPTIRYGRNLYGGAPLAVPPDDTEAVVGDPLFVDAAIDGPYGTAETGPRLETAFGLRVRSGSPAINTAAAVADNGGRDYAGTPLYNGAPDLGAFEYTTAAGATTESVTGTVRNPAGLPVSGAVVTVGGAPATATTGAGGGFSVTDVPFADGVTVTAARDGYRTGTATVDVRDGNTTTVHMVLTSTSTVGSVAGRVLDQAAQPVPGALVAVLSGDQPIGSATSGADGGFAVAGVPIGTGYTVRASATGLTAASRSGVDVAPETTTAVGALMLVGPIPDYRAVHDFDGLATGTMPASVDGLAVSGAGGGVDVVETPSATDKSVRLTRRTNSGSTSLARTFTPALAGVVTVEATVMSDEPYVSGNHWFGVPYIRGTSGQNAISVAFTKNTIVAYAGTATRTVGGYELGRWYHVKTVIDTVNQRFDLYLDGQQILDDAAFRTTMTAVAQVDYYANSSNYGSIHVDDFRVSQGVGLAPDDAGLASLDTGQGTPVATAGGRYLLEVPADVGQVEVTAVARSPFARAVAIYGERTAGTRAVRQVALGSTGAEIPVVVTAEDGTESAYVLEVERQLPQDGATQVPGRGALSTTSGWKNGLHDGAYDVTMNLWWGVNASAFVLYENGTQIARRDLTPATPAAQKATVAVGGRPNGTYVYTGELLNQAGITATTSVTVVVRDANPGKPVLSADNRDGDGDYTVRMNMWWGTNATEYLLYEDGVLVDTQPLIAATPGAQQASTVLAGRPLGAHTYVVELRNAAGSTRGDPLVVKVTG